MYGKVNGAIYINKNLYCSYLFAMALIIAYSCGLFSPVTSYMRRKKMCCCCCFFNTYVFFFYQGVLESFLGTAVSGAIFCLFAGQPLTILSSTGPVLVFERLLFNFSKYVYTYLIKNQDCLIVEHPQSGQSTEQ